MFFVLERHIFWLIILYAEEKYILNNINGNAKNLIDDKETYESIKGTLNVILKGNQCKILKVQ